MADSNNQNSHTQNQDLSRNTSSSFFTPNSNNTYGPKLSIQLKDNNYLLWNQQVEGVILTQKMHRFVVNPQIPVKFKTDQSRILNKIFDEYEVWIVQDQALFIWLLSTISEFVLPRVLSCKHSYEVWDRIHKFFNAQMRARVRQLRVELKTTKKGNLSITEFVLRIKAIMSSLLAVGDSISEKDQIDSILNGLPEEALSHSHYMMSKLSCMYKKLNLTIQARISYSTSICQHCSCSAWSK
ncbi:unnamed protein product [Vicia faba]|uniref:Retrotransposon Copia-like N-terminal domain-containing protein n=1 Tax=Vicia faba TaxID=3906 RepID=A0AAV0ZH02_VICFA|nr:unnamed protein product [Vicia faba]